MYGANPMSKFPYYYEHPTTIINLQFLTDLHSDITEMFILVLEN